MVERGRGAGPATRGASGLRPIVLLLLSIAGFGQGITHAATLVGDWYQEDPDASAGDARRAISQPVSRSSDAIDVTLGIRSPGAANPVDLYLIVSGDSSQSGCRYTVSEIVVDSSSFGVKTPAHASVIAAITTTSAAAQQRLWDAFRKGRKLSLRVNQSCTVGNTTSSEMHGFDFSLKGSSAAYRFVTGQQTIDGENRRNVETTRPAGAADADGVETPTAAESSESSWITLLAALLLAAAIGGFFAWSSRSGPTDRGSGTGSARRDPDIGDFAEAWATTGNRSNEARISPTDDEQQVPDGEPDIVNLPRYKVTHVIDGDTVIVSNSGGKLRIRLDSIDCPEGDQEWGDTAAAGLIKLIGGKSVQLEAHGIDDHGRTLATLYVRDAMASQWVNVNERMVTLGHAWVMRKYYHHLPEHRRARLNGLEKWAKSEKVGLWKLPDPVPPWDWRQASRQPEGL